jgi:hypothetical protein
VDKDKQAQFDIEETVVEGKSRPQAGPHATDVQTDNGKTPGAGTLPDPADADVVPRSG